MGNLSGINESKTNRVTDLDLTDWGVESIPRCNQIAETPQWHLQLEPKGDDTAGEFLGIFFRDQNSCLEAGRQYVSQLVLGNDNVDGHQNSIPDSQNAKRIARFNSLFNGSGLIINAERGNQTPVAFHDFLPSDVTRVTLRFAESATYKMPDPKSGRVYNLRATEINDEIVIQRSSNGKFYFLDNGQVKEALLFDTVKGSFTISIDRVTDPGLRRVERESLSMTNRFSLSWQRNDISASPSGIIEDEAVIERVRETYEEELLAIEGHNWSNESWASLVDADYERQFIFYKDVEGNYSKLVVLDVDINANRFMREDQSSNVAGSSKVARGVLKTYTGLTWVYGNPRLTLRLKGQEEQNLNVQQRTVIFHAGWSVGCIVTNSSSELMELLQASQNNSNNGSLEMLVNVIEHDHKSYSRSIVNTFMFDSRIRRDPIEDQHFDEVAEKIKQTMAEIEMQILDNPLFAGRVSDVQIKVNYGNVSDHISNQYDFNSALYEEYDSFSKHPIYLEISIILSGPNPEIIYGSIGIVDFTEERGVILADGMTPANYKTATIDRSGFIPKLKI